MLNTHPEYKNNPYISMRSRGLLLVLIVFLGLALGVGAVNLSQADTDLALLYLAFLCYLGVLVIPILKYGKTGGWFHPLIFVVLWWGIVRDVLPKLPIFSNGLSFHRVASFSSVVDLNTLVVFGLILTCLGYLSCYLGFVLSKKIRAPIVQFRRARYLRVKVLFIAIVAIFAFLILIIEAGGIDRLMVQRGISSDLRIAAEVGGHWHFMVGLLIPACLVWLGIKPDAWKESLFMVLFAVAIFIKYAAIGSRSGVILPIILAVVIWSLQNRTMPYMKGLLIALLAVVLIGLGGEFREASRTVDSASDIDFNASIFEYFESGLSTITSYKGEVDGLYGILSRVPDDVGLLWGQSYLSIPAAPIPRAFWPEKPLVGGKLTASYIFNNPLNAIPPTVIGEAFWNFHVPGVFIVMFIFGIVLRWFSNLYINNNQAGWVVVIYVYTLFYFQPTSPSFYNWIHAIVPVIIYLLFFQGMPFIKKLSNSRHKEQRFV